MPAEPVRFSCPSPHRLIVVLLDCLLVGFILNLTLQPLVEPDLGWHLRAGLDLIAQGWRLPETDPYSHTMPDWHWIEHAWLTDGLLAVIYRVMDPLSGLGLILFFGGVTALAWWVAASQAGVHRTYRLAAMVASLLGGITLSRRAHAIGQSARRRDSVVGMASHSGWTAGMGLGIVPVVPALGEPAWRVYGRTVSVRCVGVPLVHVEARRRMAGGRGLAR